MGPCRRWTLLPSGSGDKIKLKIARLRNLSHLYKIMEIDENNLKCPLCEKDVSFNWISEEIEISDSAENPIFYRILKCHHCGDITFFLYRGLTKQKKEDIEYEVTARAISVPGSRRNGLKPIPPGLIKLVNEDPELKLQYPFRKTIFHINNVPAKVKESLSEAEKCFSVGAKNGCALCLRKCIYAVCDDSEKGQTKKSVKNEGDDYVDKIEKLFPKSSEFTELAKQIKWLGDKHAHNINEEKYTNKDVEKALRIMPLIIREIYGSRQEVREVRNALNQGLQKTKAKA